MQRISTSIPQLYLQANSQLQSGHPQQAAALFQKILTLDSKNCSAALQLARILLQANQPHHAKGVLEAVFPYASKQFELLHMLAALQLQSGATEAALITVNQALELKPNVVATLNIKGNILLERNSLPAAIDTFNQALAVDHNQVDPHNNIAWAYRALGEKDKAVAHFNKAYLLDDRVTEALSGALLLQDNTPDSPSIKEARNQLTQKKLSFEQRVELNFALGKAMEDCKDYDQAFQYFSAGNQLWRQNLPYHPQDDKALFKTLKAVFDLPRITEKATEQGAVSTPTPIFVVGMPRSSTSLVEQILASHSLVNGAGELPTLNNLLFKGKQFDWAPSYREELRSAYLSLLDKHADGKPYVVDKMPQNFRFIGIILECFPDAKIIHCQRDPRDTCLSLFKHHFPMTSHPYAYEQTELANYYHLYDDLMRFWNEQAPERIYNLCYETLVNDFDTQLKQLLDYVGLAHEPSCKNFHKTSRTIRTASSDQVRRGLYKSGVGQWQNYKTPLADLFEALEQET